MTRALARAGALCAIALLAVAIGAGPASANTMLSTAGCSTSAALQLPVALGGGSSVTAADCTIAFGSGTSTAMLRMSQGDRSGSALTRSSNGRLDGSWGAGGATSHDLSAGADSATAAALATDGALLVAGLRNGTPVVLRFQASGALDGGFGASGVAALDFPGAGDDVSRIAVQSNGRILVAGSAGGGMAVARLSSSGQLDTTFSTDGYASVPVGGTTSTTDVVLRPDGAVLLVAARTAPSTELVAARLDASGALDAAGYAAPRGWIAVGAATSFAPTRAELDSSGRLVVAGADSSGAAVARLTAAGSLDVTWGGGDGIASLGLGAGSASDVALDASGRTLVAGSASGSTTGFVARLDSTGALDATYATAGSYGFDRTAGTDRATAIVARADGTVAVAVAENVGVAAGDGSLLVLSETGTPSSQFSGGGWMSIASAPSEEDAPADLVAAADGALAVVGSKRVSGVFVMTTTRLVGETIPDYGAGGDWSAGSGTFGACLREVDGPAAATWATNATCPASNGAWWNRVPATTDAGSELASTSAAGATTASADLRFGVRTTTATIGGRYVAPITVEVIAPNLDPPANTAVPTISGTTTVRKVLTASTGTWTGSGTLTYAYRWQRCTPGCSDIVAATAGTYLLDPADAGATVRVVVTASNSEGSVAATSAQTAVVAAAPANGLYYLTGFEHQATSTSGAGIVTSTPGAATMAADTTTAHAGSASMRFTGAGNNREWDVALGVGVSRTATARMYIHLSQFPAGDTVITELETDAGDFCEVSIGPSGQLRAAVYGGTVQGGPTLQLGRWYLLEYTCDARTATHVMDWRVDGAAQPQATRVLGAAGYVQVFQLGIDLNAIMDIRFDDVAVSRDIADYPLGPGKVLAHLPSGIGAVPAPASWGWSTNNMGTAATSFVAGDANQSPGRAALVDEWPITTGAGSDLFQQTGDNATLNVALADTTEPTAPTAVSIVGAQREATTGINNSVLNAVSAGSTLAWSRDPAGGSATREYYSAVLPTKPAGGAWTTTAINDLELQLTGTDASPAIWTDALLVEADYPVAQLAVNTAVPTISGTPRSGSTLTADPGTWTPSPTGYQYQWQRCNASGANCTDLAGATSQSYTAMAGDQSNTLRVRVTALTAAGNQTALSATTTIVAAGAPTLTYLTGFEHGTASTSGSGLFTTVQGSATVEQTPLARNGRSALRTDSSTTTEAYVSRSMTAGTAAVMRFAIMFAELPTVTGEIAEIDNNGTGYSCDFNYDVATGRFHAEFLSGQQSTVVVEPGRWYVIEVRCDVSGSNHALDWMIDGVPQPTVTHAAGSSGALDAVLLGSSGTTTLNATAWYDDWATSTTLADYPLGPGRVDGLQPNGTGTHATTASYQWSSNGAGTWNAWPGSDSNVIPGTSWLIDNWPVSYVAGTQGGLIQQVATTGSLEYTLRDGSVEAPPNAVRVVGAHGSATPAATQSATVTAWLGGSSVAAYTHDPSASRSYAASIVARPGGGAWTSADVDALRLGLTSSNVGTSSSERPWTHSLLAEVDYPVGAMPTSAAAPTVSAMHDAPKVGDTLGAHDGSWAGPSTLGHRYQWLRCDSAGAGCAPIAGASANTYVLQAADVGSRLRVIDLAVGHAGAQGARSAATELISTPPSYYYFTGFEHGVVSSVGGGIAAAVDPTVSVDSTVARSGGYSMQSAATTTSDGELELNSSAAASGALRFAFRYAAAPSTTTTIAELTSSTRRGRVRLTTTGQLRVDFYDGSTRAPVNGPSIQAGRWYLIDMRMTGVTTTWAIDWRVDGATQAGTSYGMGTTAAITQADIGIGSAIAMTAWFDDVGFSSTSTDFPLGDARVESLRTSSVADAPVAANFGPGASTTWAAAVAEVPMMSTAAWLAQNVITASATDHVAFAIDDPPDSRKVQAVRGIVSYGATAAGTNHIAARVQRPGDTLAASPSVFSGNAEVAALSYGGAVVPAPTGGWTPTLLAGTRWLAGFSTDVSPAPRVHGLLLEVEYRP